MKQTVVFMLVSMQVLYIILILRAESLILGTLMSCSLSNRLLSLNVPLAIRGRCIHCCAHLGSIASWRRWPFSATRRKWARRMARWGEHLIFCLDKSFRWNTRKGWGGLEALRPSTALPSSSIWLLRLFFVELQLIKNHVPSRTILLNTGARAGWERSQRLEGQKDLSAPSAACHQVKT